MKPFFYLLCAVMLTSSIHSGLLASTPDEQKISRSSLNTTVLDPDRSKTKGRTLPSPNPNIAIQDSVPPKKTHKPLIKSTSLTHIPNITLELIPRGKWSSRHSKKRIIMLNLWATWCPPCIKEIPDFNALHTTYKNHVDIIGISVDKSTYSVKKLQRELEIAYPIGLVTPGILDELPGSQALPRTIIIDTHSKKVVSDHVGYKPKAYYEGIFGSILQAEKKSLD